jgi:xanthine dehydrogenase YagS FAD-binding subunit
MRAKEAEAAIKGKSINEKSAAEAAQAALAAVQPLTMNQYKVDIARTLIQRSILGMSE